LYDNSRFYKYCESLHIATSPRFARPNRAAPGIEQPCKILSVYILCIRQSPCGRLYMTIIFKSTRFESRIAVRRQN
jgi:hypothetical protein